MKSKNAFISTENLPLVLSVPELTSVLDIGVNTAYKLVSSGQIRARRIGRGSVFLALLYWNIWITHPKQLANQPPVSYAILPSTDRYSLGWGNNYESKKSRKQIYYYLSLPATLLSLTKVLILRKQPICASHRLQ